MEEVSHSQSGSWGIVTPSESPAARRQTFAHHPNPCTQAARSELMAAEEPAETAEGTCLGCRDGQIGRVLLLAAPHCSPLYGLPFFSGFCLPPPNLFSQHFKIRVISVTCKLRFTLPVPQISVLENAKVCERLKRVRFAVQYIFTIIRQQRICSYLRKNRQDNSVLAKTYKLAVNS